MWDRKELKAKGKAAFKANYWRSVLAAVVLAVAIAGFAGGTASSGKSAAEEAQSTEELQTALEEARASDPEGSTAVVTFVVGAMAGVGLVLMAIDIFVFNPLEVGGDRFFLVNSGGPAQAGELGYGFKDRYLYVVKTIFLRDLFLALWGVLFIIPGIIKAYSYRLVPFILADDPDLSGTDAITLSRQMMDGHKLDAFLLDLSFFGWEFLSALTAGILGVFYVNPYKAATDAELYKAIKNG